jgi:hypothetical protein
MNIDPENIAAIAALGYTQEEARFLYLVAMHSGYFVPRHFLVSSGVKQSTRFATKLESRGHATWREYDRTGGVYHIVSKIIYRRIGNENLRNRRRHSIEFIRTRLLLLDFVLANPSYAYLETEQDKLRYFCEELGIPRTALPAKSYEGSPRTGPALRYFVDKFPLFLDRTCSSSSPVITLSYVDPGHAHLAGFANHIRTYLPLFRQLGDFSFVYITNSSVHCGRAGECFSSMVKAPLEADVSSELLRYFQLRNAWELKKYGSLSTSDIEWLKDATQRFHGERFDRWYQEWTSGGTTELSLRKEFEQITPHLKFTFRSWVAGGSRFGTETLSGDKKAAVLNGEANSAERKTVKTKTATQEAAQTPDEAGGDPVL